MNQSLDVNSPVSGKLGTWTFSEPFINSMYNLYVYVIVMYIIKLRCVYLYCNVYIYIYFI